MYSIIDLECLEHDPEVEQYLRDIFPLDPHDMDPEDESPPSSTLCEDSGDPFGSANLATASLPPMSHVIP